MKNNLTLKLFCLYILLFYVSTIQIEAPKELFQHTYFLQKLYPGSDSLQSLLIFNQRMTQYFFTLNKKMLFYSKSSLDKKIEDSILISKIVDKKKDNLKEGKCCVNLTFLNFAAGIKSKKSKTGMSFRNPMLLELLKANYCLDIFVPNEARWRVCSNKANHVSKLQLQIEYNILISTTGKKNNSIIEKFLKNAHTSPKPRSIDFRWEEQQKWEYRCQSTFLQSPINIKKEEIQASQDPEFSLSYNFLDTFVKIEKRYGEAIIKFINNPGLITLTKGAINIIYIPKYISFRFPGEHKVYGKQYAGEMLIHCKEINPDKKRRISNGFIITIPLESDPKYSNLNTLESLNLDFWKYSLSKTSTYIPTDFKTKAKKVFSFSNIMFIIKKDQPNYYFYLGSNTIPPCDENVYHLVISKPLKISNCQLKLIRENSLFTTSVKSIHARLTQPSNKRKVYTLTNSKLIFRPNVESFVPQEFYDLADELDDEPLFPEKLSTISQLKALKATKKLIKKGGKLTKKLKYTKKGLKIIRKGLNIKKLAIKKLGRNALKIAKKSRKSRKGKKGKKRGKTSRYAKNIIEQGATAGEYGDEDESGASGSGSGSGSADDINC